MKVCEEDCMAKMNLGRVLLGGIAAGIVIDIWEGVMRGVLLQERAADAMAALGRMATVSTKQIVALDVWGLVVGIFTVLLYAAIRPRFGAGPRAAIFAGLMIWALVFALGIMPVVLMHLLPVSFGAITVCGELVMMILAGLAGGALYKEAAGATGAGDARST
jgi:hypothetical protein